MVLKRLFDRYFGDMTKVSEPLGYLQTLTENISPKVFSGTLDLNDDAGWQDAGFFLGHENQNGEVEVVSKSAYTIRAKAGADGGVLHLIYDGLASTYLYGAMLKWIESRGYQLANSDKRADDAFLLNTYAQNDFPVGVISIFRVDDPKVTTFTISAMASQPEAKDRNLIN